MKKLLLIVVITLISICATCALPPFYQSQREINSLLENVQLYNKIYPRTILSIVRSNDVYKVSSKNCELGVKIKYLPLPGGRQGPARYEFSFANLLCKGKDPTRGFDESVIQIETLMAQQQMKDKLYPQAVESIVKNGNEYKVTTLNCHIIVKIKQDPDGFEFGQLICPDKKGEL